VAKPIESAIKRMERLKRELAKAERKADKFNREVVEIRKRRKS